MASCANMGADGDRILEWASIFLDPIRLITTCFNRGLANSTALIGDAVTLTNHIVSGLNADAKSGTDGGDKSDWEKAGETYGDMLVLVLGELPAKKSAENLYLY